MITIMMMTITTITVATLCNGSEILCQASPVLITLSYLLFPKLPSLAMINQDSRVIMLIPKHVAKRSMSALLMALEAQLRYPSSALMVPSSTKNISLVNGGTKLTVKPPNSSISSMQRSA